MTEKKKDDEIHQNLQEQFKQILEENYFPDDDEGNMADYDDTRRPRLTLRHLNKLRKIQELKKLETEAHAEFVKQMYGTPPEEGGGPEF